MSRIAALIGLAAIALPGAALACDTGEKLRLAEEQKKLAARNAWSGVERAYAALEVTKCPLDFDHHYLGAEAARYLGKVYEQYERLTESKATAGDEHAEELAKIEESLSAIDLAYGRVDIVGDPRRRPVLTRPEMPFAPDQRKAIEWAQTVVAETGSFKGMLPLGAYVVGEVEFTAEVGPDFREIVVGKVKRAPQPVAGGPAPSGPAPGQTTQTQSFLRYAHAVATVGPGFVSSPEPGEPVLLSDGGHAFAPSSVFLSGFGLQVGGEVGLTYSEPALGLAGTLGYSGGFGTDTFNLVSAWVAGVARPGNLRLALGPQYQFALGSGTGVADWFDRGQDKNTDPNEDLLYGGLSWGPGVQTAVGYGLLDFDALQGVVEVGGSWQSDGARNYFSFGLRVGVVPTVPRFEG